MFPLPFWHGLLAALGQPLPIPRERIFLDTFTDDDDEIPLAGHQPDFNTALSAVWEDPEGFCEIENDTLTFNAFSFIEIPAYIQYTNNNDLLITATVVVDFQGALRLFFRYDPLDTGFMYVEIESFSQITARLRSSNNGTIYQINQSVNILNQTYDPETVGIEIHAVGNSVQATFTHGSNIYVLLDFMSQISTRIDYFKVILPHRPYLYACCL